jgi:anti-anti-sigma factor
VLFQHQNLTVNLRKSISHIENSTKSTHKPLIIKGLIIGTQTAPIYATHIGDSVMELRKIQASETIDTLIINGNLDADGSRSAQPHIDQIIAEDSGRDVEIDFSQVQFLDSSGVGAIVYLYKRLIERQRSMRIENVSGQPLEIINLLRISQAIPVNSHTH